MYKLDESLERLKFDTRMQHIYLQQGLISQVELDKHVSALQDLSSLSLPVSLEDLDDAGDYDSSANGHDPYPV